MRESSCYWKAVVLLLLISCSDGARILGIVPIPAKSHNIVLLSLLEELAARQHEVTVISYHPQEKPRPNYTDITLNREKLSRFNQTDMFAMSKMSSFTKLTMLWTTGNIIGDIIFQEPKVQELIHSKDKKFDLIIVEAFFNDAFYGFSHLFNAPFVAVCPFGGIHWMGHMVGNPSPFAYVPDVFLNYNDHMTFIQRLHNTLIGVYGLLGHAFYYTPKQEALMRKYLNNTENLPSLWELRSHTSLFLANAHVSLSYPVPTVPNFVQVGGMHIKPPKKLPQDLQQYLDDAPDGVIYFSMGSALQSAKLPETKQEALIETFSRLKQKVLWKWEDDKLPNQPSNLKISKWFPQADILAHPNVKLFITHGGLLSTMEAIYNGVPLIGIPIFGDQEMNMAQAETKGYGILVSYSNLTSDSLGWAVKEMLHQPRYRENAKKLSRLFKDQPETPMERAVYWVEYVLRHKGAAHLRSASLDLSWYQYFLLDVIAVILISIVLSVSLVFILIKSIMSIFKRKGPKDTKKSKEKKRK